MNAGKRQRGVTLVETLVALAIMGLVTSSLLVLVGQNTRFLTSARDRTYASIAIDNLMVESLAISSRLEFGEEFGQIEVAGREWEFRRTITETGVINVSRIDIAVFSPGSQQVIANASTLRTGGGL